MATPAFSLWIFFLFLYLSVSYIYIALNPNIDIFPIFPPNKNMSFLFNRGSFSSFKYIFVTPKCILVQLCEWSIICCIILNRPKSRCHPHSRSLSFLHFFFFHHIIITASSQYLQWGNKQYRSHKSSVFFNFRVPVWSAAPHYTSSLSDQAVLSDS